MHAIDDRLRVAEGRCREAEARAARVVEENARFRSLFEQGAQLCGILDPAGRMLEVNRLALDTIGMPREAVIGVPFWDGAWWGGSAVVRELVKSGCERAAAGEYFRTEIPFVGAEGDVRYADVVIGPVRDLEGRLAFLSATGVDVTDKRRAEDELRRQTDRMRLLWEAASILLTTEDPDSMMRGLFARLAPHFDLDVYFNFMVDDTGEALRLESCLGIPGEAVRAIRRLEFGQAVCGAVAQTRTPITETHIQQSDKPRVQLVKGFGVRVYTCNPLLAEGRLLGTLSFASRSKDEFAPDEIEFLRTICRYVTAAYERLWLVRELRDADRKKDDFIALLAHELRNPLAPISNGLQILNMTDDGDVVGQVRSMMDRQMTHMVRLVDDLLDVSRINRNKLRLRRGRITLADAVAAAVETVRPLVDAAGHELTVSLPARPVHLDADLTRLSQVLSNLLNNSCKYSEGPGRIRLTARTSGAKVAVSVQDDGVGIPSHALGSIFDMFSQVDRSLEKKAGGLGIGLAIVKGLVEMHGGSVAVESRGEGEGSTFTITLPTLREEAVAEPRGVEGPAAGATGRALRLKVLVVDDNLDGASSLASMLRLAGEEVRTANDGWQAIEEAERFRPDVILMDLGMPRLNGLDATRRIRWHEWGRSMRIIALTGWGQEADRERSRAAGCDAHLIKPVHGPELDDQLAGVRLSRMRADAPA